ncbi:MAG: SIR2 family protein [Sedimenticolaceae bacterium]
MADVTLQDLIEGVQNGTIVPYLGPGVLADVVNRNSGESMPADSNSLILAMNNGKPMSPRLMYEFPRAAMDVELKRGRGALHRFLDATYGHNDWTRSTVHDWLATIKPPYVIDINRDMQLQQSYADTRHTLIRGIARVGGTDYRFRIHSYDGRYYSEREVDQDDIDPSLPVLFKPMGSPLPDATYIASDADFVDYITELMGGFAIPDFIKSYRKGKQYLFIGLRMNRDTERMVLSDFIYSAGRPAGWVLVTDPTDKERRFCNKQGLEIVEAEIETLLTATAAVVPDLAGPAAVRDVGC